MKKKIGIIGAGISGLILANLLISVLFHALNAFFFSHSGLGSPILGENYLLPLGSGTAATGFLTFLLSSRIPLRRVRGSRCALPLHSNMVILFTTMS